MRFLFLLHGDEGAEAALSPAERRAIVDQHIAFSRDLRAEGRMLGGDPLSSSREGRIVRRRGVVDGPFVETKEQIGGYYLIEAVSLDEAVEIAKRVPESPGAAIEVRAIPEY